MICHLLYQYIEQNWLYCEVGYAPLILWEVCMLTWQQYPWEHLTSYPTHYNSHRLVLILRSHLTGEYVHWFSFPFLHTYKNKDVDRADENWNCCIQVLPILTTYNIHKYSTNLTFTWHWKAECNKRATGVLWRQPSNCNALTGYMLFPLV